MNKEKFYILTTLLILICSCSTENDTTTTQTVYDDSVVFGTSANELYDWEISSPIIEHASVPDLIQLTQDLGEFEKGTLLSYFVDSSESLEEDAEKIGMVYSIDNGKTWSDLETITILGAEEHIPVDPSIVQLDNGNMRLYYYNINAFRNHDNSYSIYVAESTDGINFELLQTSYTSESLIMDPEVVFFNDKWFMYVSQEGIIILNSDDGLTFNKIGFSSMLGSPGAVVVENSVHLYGCGNGGVTRAISNDGIIFNQEEVVIRNRVCDPSPILLNDGTYAIVLKMFPE